MLSSSVLQKHRICRLSKLLEYITLNMMTKYKTHFSDSVPKSDIHKYFMITWFQKNKSESAHIHMHKVIVQSLSDTFTIPFKHSLTFEGRPSLQMSQTHIP